MHIVYQYIPRVSLTPLLGALEQQSFSQEQQKSLVRDVIVCFPHALVRIT
jgi:hypothetical protein